MFGMREMWRSEKGGTSVGGFCMEILWTHTTPTTLAVPIKPLTKPIQVDACSLK